MRAIVGTPIVHRPDLDIPPPRPPQATNISPPPLPPEPPTLIEMVANFSGAMARWAAAGFPTVDAAELEQRLNTCRACENWGMVLGFGRCKVCGCFGLKLWLKTERCRHPKGSRWPQNEFVKSPSKE